MEALDIQTRDIVVYQNRKRLYLLTGIGLPISLLVVGMDVFAIWAFWNQYDIDTGAYVAAIVLPIGTLIVGWAMFIYLYRLSRHGPAITINPQGLYVDLPLRFTLLPRGRNFIPWEEIAWISSVQVSMYKYLTLSLKDPAHYWSLYAYGKYREWRRDRLTGAHINIPQYPLSLPAAQILQ